MRRLLFLALALVAAAGCKKSRADRCNEAWTRNLEATQKGGAMVGASDDDLLDDDDKKQFLEDCVQGSEAAYDCLADPTKVTDEKCNQLLAAERDRRPAPQVALEWETVDAIDKRATARVPKGWDHEQMFGDEWTPPQEKHQFSMARFSIETGCRGDCEPMPAATWAKRVDTEFAQLAGEEGATVVSDDKLGDTGRIAVVRSSQLGTTMTTVLAAYWKDGGEDYVMCRAELDRKFSSNVDDFVQACRDLKVTSFASTSEDDDDFAIGSDAGAPARDAAPK